MSAHPGCRIRSVKLKGGGPRIVRLTDGAERSYASIMAEMRDLIAGMREEDASPVGFAVIAWDGNFRAWCALKSYPGSPLPPIFVPDFVRNRLLAEKICEWTDQ